MAQVLIYCPQKGVPVSTGIRMTRPNLAKWLGERMFRCNRCGEIHAWRRNDALQWSELLAPIEEEL